MTVACAVQCDVAIVGATGYTGELCARRLAATGVRLRLVGRSADKLHALAVQLAGATVAVSRLDDPAQLKAALTGARVVLSCAGPFAEIGLPVAEASVAVGAHYCDISGELRFAVQLESVDDAARAAGVAVVPCCGFDAVVGETAAVRAAAALASTVVSARLTVATTTQPSRGSLQTIWEGLCRRDYEFGFRAGALVALPIAASRWQATLPAPFGRSSVAGFGLVELWSVGRALRCQEVQTGLAVPVPAALSIAARLAAWLGRGGGVRGVIREVVRKLIGRLPAGGNGNRRARSVTVLHAELTAADGGTAVVTATCGDISELTATCVTACVLAALATHVTAGVQTPTLAFGADYLADQLGQAGVSFVARLGAAPH